MQAPSPYDQLTLTHVGSIVDEGGDETRVLVDLRKQFPEIHVKVQDSSLSESHDNDDDTARAVIDINQARKLRELLDQAIRILEGPHPCATQRR